MPSSSIVSAAPAFVAGTFDAQDVRLAAIGNAVAGKFAAADFDVTERAAGANMSVDIAAGRAFVDPQAATHQGMYVARMEASYNTSSDGGITWTAADATNPRIDLLCIEVADTDFSGAYTGWKFRVVDGTPNAGATDELLTAYWPAVPTGCLAIAAIRIPATATTITTANIHNIDTIGGRGNPTKPQMYGYQTGAQTHDSGSGSWDKVLLDATLYDTGATRAHWQSASNDFVIVDTGMYSIAGGVRFAVNATGYRQAAAFLTSVAGTAIALGGMTPNASQPNAVTFATHRRLTAGDIVCLGAWQNSGGNLALDVGSSTECYLSLVMLSE